MTPYISNSIKMSYNLQTLIKNLNFLHEEKEKVKVSIKDWTENFEKMQKRKASQEDKKQISNLYTLYNNYNQQIKVLEDKLDSVKNLKAQLSKVGNETTNKSKSVSPRKAHLAKLMQMNKNVMNCNSNNLANMSIDNQNTNISTIINTSVNQSFEIGNHQKNNFNDKSQMNTNKETNNLTVDENQMQNNNSSFNNSVSHSFDNGNFIYFK